MLAREADASFSDRRMVRHNFFMHKINTEINEHRECLHLHQKQLMAVIGCRWISAGYHGVVNSD